MIRQKVVSLQARKLIDTISDNVIAATNTFKKYLKEIDY